jgi:NAD+ diphosphatase
MDLTSIGSPLNRLSFLREDPSFISTALTHPSSQIVLLSNLAPLAKTPSKLHYASYRDIESLIPSAFFSMCERDAIQCFDSSNVPPLLVFLGIDESRPDGFAWGKYQGTPTFALDLTTGEFKEPQSVYEEIIEAFESQGSSFLRGKVIMSLTADEGTLSGNLRKFRKLRFFEAAIYAQARTLVDWNTRNAFCGSCGSRTMSVNAGAKRVCAEIDRGKSGFAVDLLCTTRTTISNISFPRTDPTIIAAVLSADSKRILMGRSARLPLKWYSPLAGFVEPAESVEDAVRREIWEEAGVILSQVVIHSSQPWPYPAGLMIGAIGHARDKESESISLDHDPELEDAKWFDIAEVEEGLQFGISDIGGQPGPDYKGGLILPPPSTIVYHLLLATVKRARELSI